MRHAFPVVPADRSPPTWWEGASTVWRRIMWPPAALSRRAASAANRLATWPRTASAPASLDLCGDENAPRGGSCLPLMLLRRPTSRAGAIRRPRPLPLRRGRPPRVVPTPAPLRSAQLHRWVARRRRRLALGRSFHGAILHVVRNSSPDSTPLCRPDACMLCYWYDLLYLG